MVRKITRDELMNIVSSGIRFALVDVLPEDHFKNEHIKGALSLPVGKIEKKAEGMLKKDDLIVTYCANFDCQASTLAAEKLMSLGYKNVLDYKGGLQDYKEANLPLEGSMHEGSSMTHTCLSC